MVPTVTKATERRVREDVVLMPVRECAGLLKEGRRKLLSEGGVVSILDIDVVKDLWELSAWYFFQPKKLDRIRSTEDRYSQAPKSDKKTQCELTAFSRDTCLPPT